MILRRMHNCTLPKQLIWAYAGSSIFVACCKWSQISTYIYATKNPHSSRVFRRRRSLIVSIHAVFSVSVASVAGVVLVPVTRTVFAWEYSKAQRLARFSVNKARFDIKAIHQFESNRDWTHSWTASLPDWDSATASAAVIAATVTTMSIANNLIWAMAKQLLGVGFLLNSIGLKNLWQTMVFCTMYILQSS